MPDSLDRLTILPKMSGPNEKGHIFKLIWVLDLVSNSFKSYISLPFQNRAIMTDAANAIARFWQDVWLDFAAAK